MILEAFAEYLQAADQKTSATELLGCWLLQKLSAPPSSAVDRVLHCEISLLSSSKAMSKIEAEKLDAQPADSDKKLVSKRKSSHFFKGNSPSGAKLLKSLYEYCLSYEQQKWSRWVHSIKASDFKQRKQI